MEITERHLIELLEDSYEAGWHGTLDLRDDYVKGIVTPLMEESKKKAEIRPTAGSTSFAIGVEANNSSPPGQNQLTRGWSTGPTLGDVVARDGNHPQVRADQVRADQVRADQVRADQVRADQVRADQTDSASITVEFVVQSGSMSESSAPSDDQRTYQWTVDVNQELEPVQEPSELDPVDGPEVDPPLEAIFDTTSEQGGV